MHQEVLFIFRGIETIRLEENSCEEFYFRRSNAIRRKKKKSGTLSSVKCAKEEIEKCIKSCGLLHSVQELRETKTFRG